MTRSSPVLLIFVVLAACGPPEPAGLPVRGLLAQGVAHAEINQWQEALALFLRAANQAPDEPLAAYDVAVAQFRLDDRAAAGEWLERALAAEAPGLVARAQLLRARLAYEDGDEQRELAAHLEASRLAPDEPAYFHALAELYERLPEAGDRGAALASAYRLWPENARLASAHARWLLEQPAAELRDQGLAILDQLAVLSGQPEIAAYVERGRREIAQSPAAGPVPVALRRALNLLRATKKFASDAAEISERLEVLPLAELDRGRGPPAAGRRSEEPSRIRFEIAAGLVPDPPLADGEGVVDVAIVDDMASENGTLPPGRRDAALALLSDRGLFFLPRDGDVWQRLAEVAAGRRLLAGDFDDDGRSEILALTVGGFRLWGRGDSEGWRALAVDPDLAGADLHQGLLVDFEHDGDLDLLALDAGGSPVLVTNRGEAGLGPPGPAPLPVDAPVRCLHAADLDLDADQDLLLALQGGAADQAGVLAQDAQNDPPGRPAATLRVPSRERRPPPTTAQVVELRNWRQGEYAPGARIELASPQPSGLLTLDYDGDRRIDLVAAADGGLAFWRGAERLRWSRDPTAAQDVAEVAVAEPGAPACRRQPVAADLDLDGDLDLVVAGAAGIAAAENLGGGRFHVLPKASLAPAAGLLALDLDGDRAPDLLAWEGGALRSLRTAGAEGASWLALSLRAPNRKVPLDGRGVRVEVTAGERTQLLAPSRPNLLIGLGADRPALVKATWPNGISEYLFEPAPETRHTLTLSLRVEGSCPFLYASDGDRLRFVTDVLGLAPLGMLAARGRYVPADPEEYVRLPAWTKPRNGVLELLVSEELREVLYLDQAELVAVDAPAGVEVYNGEQWLETPVAGLALRLLTPLQPPASVRDHRGREVLAVVRDEDERYLTNHTEGRRYQGAAAPHRLVVELPAEVAERARPALVLVGWLHWGSTSTNLARSQDPAGAPLFPFLEVPDRRGGWRRVDAAAGLPAGKTKPVVVDLTGVLDPADAQVRITTDFEVYWDRIAAANLLPPEATGHRVHRRAPSSAELRFGGFSRWYRPAANGPYLFDYRERRPYPWREGSVGREQVLSWREHEGFYTAYGDVAALLAAADDRLVVLGSGEEVALRFAVSDLPPLPRGWQRTFFFHSEGWEKDGDPNVACSQTVEPLPYRAMARYPCPPGDDLAAAGNPAAAAPRSRWVSGERLERRVLASKFQ